MSRRLLGLLGGLALLALAGLLTSPIALLFLLLFRPRSGALPKIIDEAATPFADIGQLVRPLFFVAFAILIVIWAVARLSADATILDTPFAQLTLINLGALCLHVAMTPTVLLWWWAWAFSRKPKNYCLWGCAGLAGIGFAIVLAVVFSR